MLHLNALIRSRIVRSFNDGDDELAVLSSAIPEERFRERDMVRLHIFRFLIEQQRVLFEESFSDILVIRTDAWHVVEQVEIQFKHTISDVGTIFWGQMKLCVGFDFGRIFSRIRTKCSMAMY